VAIFDADFIPAPDSLTQSIPQFHDPRVGMVQSRWSFCNSEHSWLTGVQALLLGPHFSIEHQVRFQKGLFFNFNGTAGIWRRQAIADAGGWQSDTVTEDLDLSYRAQLAGWRFVYLDGYEVPSELPVTLAAFRSQQQRWAKGSVQTARKILPQLFRGAAVRGEMRGVEPPAGEHLLASGHNNIPHSLSDHRLPDRGRPLADDAIGSSSFCCNQLCHHVVLFCLSDRQPRRRVHSSLPPSACCEHRSRAQHFTCRASRLVEQGRILRADPKIRHHRQEQPAAAAFLYRQKGLQYLLLNSLFLLYSLLPLSFAWQRGTWYALPLFVLFPAGFLAVIIQELHELRAGYRAPTQVALSQNVSPTGLSET
jgi:hypothetical protein